MNETTRKPRRAVTPLFSRQSPREGRRVRFGETTIREIGAFRTVSKKTPKPIVPPRAIVGRSLSRAAMTPGTLEYALRQYDHPHPSRSKGNSMWLARAVNESSLMSNARSKALDDEAWLNRNWNTLTSLRAELKILGNIVKHGINHK